MPSDRVVGGALFAVSIIIIIAYAYLVFLTDWWEIVIKLTGLAAVGGFFGLLAWIGYTLATTPPPKPIEEIEKEIEEELKKLEQELKEGEKAEGEGEKEGETTKPGKEEKPEEKGN
ncbi:MAG: transcriptional regulator [Aeropyrum sp.]|nr:transcriptional regulator [Aeropyrum sp.]MCE4615521.1 transcriptional regulator [Aeropyrum sp.]